VGTKLGTNSGGFTDANREVAENTWLPPRDSNPDMLIQSPAAHDEEKEDKGLSSAESSKVRQNPQQIDNKKSSTGR
jgi:hypothetical protein